MDLTQSIVPKSDQLNADDLITGPVTVTISDVTEGNTEQPVNVHLLEFPGRAYRPSKSMRRILVSAWGAEGKLYAGHQLRLYRNPEIMFGRDRVGGIEISHLSHLEKPLVVALTATRGRRKDFTVHPLPAAPPSRDWAAELQQTSGNIEAVGALGRAAEAAQAPAGAIAAIRAEFNRLQPPPTP
ncbi:hypothetical protein [Frondihabitans sp. VKM Ac-2883]|uniref:hypothetical protein n=1 Tax=Frondihabitans sp. VKM Ac-2883 TaxID=2783823 RepID=UPI00188C6BAC|nr:hypothetical protein [Frondihabitans sp. VKM Ac-2883]MBF4574705.1 hypothetical protein [Frondihabitans sp. VKM Ac-2883]